MQPKSQPICVLPLLWPQDFYVGSITLTKRSKVTSPVTRKIRRYCIHPDKIHKNMFYDTPVKKEQSESKNVETLNILYQSLSHVRLFATPWTVAHQTSLFTGFPRQEQWSGLPFPPPGDLLDPGIEPTSPALQTDSLPLSHQGSP